MGDGTRSTSRLPGIVSCTDTGMGTQFSVTSAKGRGQLLVYNSWEDPVKRARSPSYALRQGQADVPDLLLQFGQVGLA